MDQCKQVPASSHWKILFSTKNKIIYNINRILSWPSGLGFCWPSEGGTEMRLDLEREGMRPVSRQVERNEERERKKKHEI
ncbi:hypothetical protein PV327_000638 [Microctonus hyperodae]|uniref:Uncharacterized protein n=1 Tax=Microctonus hyperodae TaxID=165561 RepID=A0AA39L2H1_MICHY|nr:hypothetical protein PV327_000638 [Microctonus hyperodae]